MALASARARAFPRTLAAPRLNLRLAVGLLVLGAAILGLVVVYRAAQPRTVEVLRAAHDLSPGQVLRVEDLQVVAAALPDEIAARLVAAGERGGLIGRRLDHPLNAGDLVTRRQVEPATRQLGAGERLYALPIATDTATGLHLQPSDQVEIVVTTNKTRPELAQTQVVLPTVTIFSIGSSDSGVGFAVASTSDRGGSGSSRLTTVVLRTDDAGYQALARARQVGDLDVALVGAPETPR
ncbi:MAG: RcpC/CpaB family pilus assembly protein [Pseudonocardiales bacterium]